MNKNIKSKKILSLAAILMVLFFTFYPPLNSQATALSGISDQMTRIQQNILANHDIRFRVATAGLGDSNDTMVIDFDDDFTKGTTDYTDVDFFYGSSQAEVNGSCSSNCTNATLAAAQGDNIWGVVWDGGTARQLTFTYPSVNGTAVAANDYVRVLIGTNAASGDQQMTNPNNTNVTLILVTTYEDGSTEIDSGSIAIAMIADDTVTVNGTVDPSITFVISGGDLSGMAIDLGAITTTALTIKNHNVTTTTNAVSGYTTRMYEDNDLRSTATPADTIDDVSDGTVTINNEEYGMATEDTGVEVTQDTGGGTTGEASAITTTQQSVATYSGPVTSDEITVYYKVAVSGLTKAHNDYSHNVTFVSTGNF